jgi:hypothetical protein
MIQRIILTMMIILTGVFILFLCQFGTAALLACFLGFLLARTIALRSAAEVR